MYKKTEFNFVISRKQESLSFFFGGWTNSMQKDTLKSSSFPNRLTFEAFSLRETCGSSEHLTTEDVFSMKYEAMIE